MIGGESSRASNCCCRSRPFVSDMRRSRVKQPGPFQAGASRNSRRCALNDSQVFHTGSGGLVMLWQATSEPRRHAVNALLATSERR